MALRQPTPRRRIFQDRCDSSVHTARDWPKALAQEPTASTAAKQEALPQPREPRGPARKVPLPSENLQAYQTRVIERHHQFGDSKEPRYVFFRQGLVKGKKSILA
jgi:hypothetical protein